jgi:hypothetical protein
MSKLTWTIGVDHNQQILLRYVMISDRTLFELMTLNIYYFYNILSEKYIIKFYKIHKGVFYAYVNNKLFHLYPSIFVNISFSNDLLFSFTNVIWSLFLR